MRLPATTLTATVLIVDDSASTRAAVRAVVRASGVRDDRIFEACDGREALSLFEKAWIDVVLLDINMPNMDGETFARTIRARADLGDVRIVVVSSESDRGLHQRLIALGVDGILGKPFRPEELRQTIGRVISGSLRKAA